MATKTKAELMEEIKTKNNEIKDLKNEIEKLERYKQYEDMANEFGAMREAFVNSGFSKAEGFTMVMKTMDLATNPMFMSMINK